MLERGAKFLKLVYESPRWRIWEVRGTDPPASGGAKLLAAGPNWFMVDADQADARALPLHALLVDQRRLPEPRAGRLDAGRAARGRRRRARAGASSAWSEPAAQRGVSPRGVTGRSRLASRAMSWRKLLPRGARGPVVADPAVLRRLLGLPARARPGLRPVGGGLRARAPDRRRREGAAPVHRAVAAELGDPGALDRRRRLLDVPQHALRRDDVHAGVHLPVPQRALLLGAEHVHGRDGAGARRLRRSIPPRRRGCCPSSASWTRSRTSPASPPTPR